MATIRVLSIAVAWATVFINLSAAADPTALTTGDVFGPGFSITPTTLVNGRNGAATYSYSFALPPSRGPGPVFSLVYTSNASARSDVAEGWTLSAAPAIRRDVTREASANDRAYVTDFGGMRELVPTPGDVPALGGAPYRARIDTDFTRFSR